MGEPHLGPPMHRRAGDLFPLKKDVPLVGSHEPHRHVEGAVVPPRRWGRAAPPPRPPSRETRGRAPPGLPPNDLAKLRISKSVMVSNARR